MTQYDPAAIAAQLVQEHGLDEAIETATEGIHASQQAGDFYALSVWREVRRHLQSRRDRDAPPH
jgi:hydroxymethylpyrimidine/phosphomethylpyrimidine kinase